MWQDILVFLHQNWFKLGLLLWMFYLVGPFGRKWFKEQIEWIKGLFYDDDDVSSTHKDAPSHKNATLLALVVVFIIVFLRKIALSDSPDIPDIPMGWQMVILTGLGIAAAKSGAQKLFENKWGNGDGHDQNAPPTP